MKVFEIPNITIFLKSGVDESMENEFTGSMTE